MPFLNFSTPSTTPQKVKLNATSPTSPLPFCTSPTDLHNAFKESTKDGKSQVGGCSRSVKEFEEQLTNLKKENFNLKLRIYFLEEKLGVNFTLDEDNALKKNIELKVEIANLQKDLQEKHDLLCQAVKAIELEDEEHKKYLQIKEDQLNQCYQELEELKLQLHDAKYDDGFSHKSDPTGMIFNHMLPLHDTDSLNNIKLIQEKCISLEKELNNEKENCASIQILLDQAESAQHKLKVLEHENKEKDIVIVNFKEDLENIRKKNQEYSDLIKDLEVKLVQSNNENQHLIKELEENTSQIGEFKGQVNELKKMHSNLRLEIEREQKKSERAKMFSDIRISELEAEAEKHKAKVRELNGKLDFAQHELKKNKNLAVSSCQVQKTNTSNTDENFSDSNPATLDRTPQKDALSLSLKSSHSTPEKFDVSQLEQLLLGAGESATVQQILSGVNLLKNDHSIQKQKVIKLKAEQIKACEIIKSMIASRNKLNDENILLKKKYEICEKKLLEACNNKKPLYQQLSDLKITAINSDEKSMAESPSEDLSEHYKALSNELEAKIELLKVTLEAKDLQILNLKTELEEVFKCLAEKENKVVDLEFELLSINNNENSRFELSTEKTDVGTEKIVATLKTKLENKDKEIDRLNTELRKCNCYLQEIVNKELWEKNREIEKMHNKQSSLPEIAKLKEELEVKDSQLRLLKETINELGLDIPIPGNAGDTDLKNVNANHNLLARNIQKEKPELNQLLDELKDQNNILSTELEHYKKLYEDTHEASAILSQRLEELAIFLDSLLKNKSVLGFLGNYNKKRVREIVDNSLELSRSFTMSLMVNPEQSLAQLSNITALLNGSILQDLSLNNIEDESTLSINPSQITLTYHSHLNKPNQVLQERVQEQQIITTLREQITNLKYALQLRDHELNRINNIKEFSDKMNVFDEKKSSHKLNSKLKKEFNITMPMQTENQSESESWSEPDINVSKERIGLSNTLPNFGTKKTDLSTEDSFSEKTSSRYNTKSISDLYKQIHNLKRELHSKNEELINVQISVEKTVNTLENQIKVSEEKCANMQILLKDVTKSKTKLEESMVQKDKETQDKINQLQMEKESLLKTSQEFEVQANKAKQELKSYENKLTKVNEEWELVKIRLRQDYEEYTAKKLKNAEEAYLKRIKEVEDNSNSKMVKLENKIKEIHETNAKHFVQKSYLDKAYLDLQEKVHQIESLNNDIVSYKDKITSLETQKKDLHELYNNSLIKVDTIYKELNIQKVQYSELLLEKIKLSNERVELEEKLGSMSVAELEMNEQFEEIQNEMEIIKQSYQQQCTALQNQKSILEVKVSELESINAELHNRLAKLQLTTTAKHNVSIPSCLSNKKHNSFGQQYLDGVNAEECNTIRPFNQTAPPAIQPVDIQRLEANSSPDLGIESDQGRFSSLETHGNVPRPILQTIELTESMNNLLDAENVQYDAINCGNENCCQKILDFSKENNELKRKLLRMKRALEETANQLSLANQRKKQVEKTICKQIHKTSQVLKKAKANLDSGSESDVLKK
ncbi:unnamed protein product [Brassicogethes aeneus]|uniref:Centrosomin N-terminal motif 1 domain-containing protein n=1 Tax=Brassicogethes aeneus TaxID=1431903 RepID=A0A9P0B9I1_BRAAE|nr:unnamed protein product [Brassicogethes aeneus]